VYRKFKFRCGVQAAEQVATAAAADHLLAQVAHIWYYSFALIKAKHIVFVQGVHIAAGENKLLQEYVAIQHGLTQQVA
jgi:hypothetical protein